MLSCTKILYLTIKLKKGHFRRLTGEILGGGFEPIAKVSIKPNIDYIFLV